MAGAPGALTELTVANLARAAGLPEQQVPMAVAVAIYESGLNPNSRGDKDNPRPGCESLGLWQINSCPNYGKGFPRYSDNHDALLNPMTNARAMVSISANGTNWKPWTTRAKATAAEPAVRKRLAEAGYYNVGDNPNGMWADDGTYIEPRPGGTDTTGMNTTGSTMSIWVRIAWFLAGMGLVGAGVQILGGDLFTDVAGKLTGTGSPDTGGDPLDAGDPSAPDVADAVSGMTTGVPGA